MQYSIAPGSIISVYVQSSHSSAALHGRIAGCRLERMLNTLMQRLQTCATQQVHGSHHTSAAAAKIYKRG